MSKKINSTLQEIESKNQKTLKRFSLDEKIKDITSNILSKLPTKKE